MLIHKQKMLFMLAILFFAMAGLTFSQATGSKDVNVTNTPNVNVVNTPTVGIDPAKNTVQVANAASGPLAVVVTSTAVRRPFQARVNLQIADGANADSKHLDIPAGKRLVIENVSALTFGPQGQGLLINFTTAVQDTVGDNAVGGFENHDVVLTSQGIFNSLERMAASQNTLAFADETVQTPNGILTGLDVVVNLSRGTLTGTAGARVTITGYVEDLPVAQ
jgi:hypothetical protein